MNSNWQDLANAIVEQAAKDYEEALCEDHHCSTFKTRASIRELERYFTGEYIKMHTKLDGPTLMHRIRADVEALDYDLKAIRHAHSLSGGEEA